MLEAMTVRRVVISMPEALVEALNRETAASPESRSEIICEAVRRYLHERARPSSRTGNDVFDRVAERIRRRVREEQVQERESDGPESKIWIN
jgi:metal-responsive CopG/Arc/MetJ family transcriptional regulator